MKNSVSLIILVLYLLQPLACFTSPCDSSLGSTDIVDTSGHSGSDSHSHDGDNCESNICCVDAVFPCFVDMIPYAPLVSLYVVPERDQQLPSVVIPIFIPPQNLA